MPLLILILVYSPLLHSQPCVIVHILSKMPFYGELAAIACLSASQKQLNTIDDDKIWIP